MDNYFAELNAVNVNDHTEKKGNLTYLSWAWAWGEIKKRHPGATYTVYENDKGWNYHTDGKTAWVKTGVSIPVGNVARIEHIEYLPVMDSRNRSIPLAEVTSFDVNKTIQRSLTKACARHGLGLYIYAGEDLPDDGFTPVTAANSEKPYPTVVCERCGEEIKPVRVKGQIKSVEDQIDGSQKTFGKNYCRACAVAVFTSQTET